MSIWTGCIRVGGERVVEGTVRIVGGVSSATGQILIHQSRARWVVGVHQYHRCCTIQITMY